MAYSFGDSFDLYSTNADPLAGYWDGGTVGVNFTLVAGRFSGSQACRFASGATTIYLLKNSGANDAVHHICCAFQQTAALSGTTLANFLQFADGATGQCCIVFRSDGAIVLTSGTPGGTALDTYTGAVTANNTWFAFEFEVVINNTTGSWAVRKNGNTSNDHALGSLNTRAGTVNNYANRLQFGQQATLNAQYIDDLFWQSGASTGNWLGDIRCYTRRPASDVASPQFSRAAGATNASQSNETPQDGTTSYVYDSTVNDADFYNIASLTPAPASVIAVTTRGFMAKSNTATRTATVRLKSGATTVSGATATLATTFGWASRTDVTDPNTSAAWTAAAVDSAQIGPIVLS